MADYDSQLPVRSKADGTDERVHVKIVDGATPANRASVSDGNVHVEIHGNRCDDADDVVMRLSEQGRPNPRADYEADDNSCPAHVGLIVHARNASPADSQQTQRLTAITNGAGDVRALDVAIRDESGEPFTAANPLPVSFEASEGSEVHDFDKATAVVKDASSDHDFSVANADNFQLAQVLLSASGKMKAELQIGDGAVGEVFVSKVVRFNSTANPQCDIAFAAPLSVVGTVNTTTVKVIKTNLDNQPQDLYSTIIGVTV